MQNFDARKNVLQGILKGAKSGLASHLKKKYRAPAPNLEDKALQPVPGAEEKPPEEDELASILEQMIKQRK